MTKTLTLEERVQTLENTIQKNEGSTKEKKKRSPSKYNEFVQKFFKDNVNSSKTHKELFGEAAKAWSENKK